MSKIVKLLSEFSGNGYNSEGKYLETVFISFGGNAPTVPYNIFWCSIKQ